MRTLDQPKPPRRRPFRPAALADGDLALLEPTTDLESLRYAGLRLEKLDIGIGSVVNGCEFDDVAADELSLDNSRAVETRFHQLGVPSLRMARTILRDVEFDASRLGAVEAYDLDAQTVHFIGCRISYLNLRGSKLLDFTFTDCVIEDIDLAQVNARRFAFPNTRIQALTLHNTTVADFDLRGAELESVRGWASLRGATVTADQLAHLAPQMAVEMGLRVD